MVSVALPLAARAFAKTQLAAHQSAVWLAPEMTCWGMVTAPHLSGGLFDQDVMDCIFTTVSAVIQIQPPTQQRPQPSLTPRSLSLPKCLAVSAHQQQQQQAYCPPPVRRTTQHPQQQQQQLQPFWRQQSLHRTSPQPWRPANQP